MREQQQALHSSDVAYIATVLLLIESGRKSSHAVQFQDATAPFQILCFLGDRIQLQSVRHYLSAQSLLSDLLLSFNVVPIGSNTGVGQLFVDKVQRGLQNLQSVDDLVHFVDSVQTLFINDVNCSPNESVAPTRICFDSSLGVFCRSFVAKWECLSFDSICQLYESLRVFLRGTSDGGFDLTRPLSAQSQPISNDESTNVHRFLQQAEDAAENGDVHAAERLLHRYFDSNGNDPLLSVASKGNTGSSTHLALAALHHANDPQFTGTRHQQALLLLAAMWSRNGHYPLAMAAVEEAMKTAHQRGDHGSVARALLLLYHVVSGLNSSECAGLHVDGVSATSIGAEEVLRRCLDRCSTLGMNALASQATVLLARLLSSRALSWTQSAYLSDWLGPSDDEIEAAHSDSGIGRHIGCSSVKNTWTLLLCTHLGEANMCSLISKGGASPCSQPAGAVTPATVKESSASLSSHEVRAIQAQSDLVAVDFWCRLSVPALAELQCRRALRSRHSLDESQMSNEMLVTASCKLATFIVMSAFDDIDDLLFLKYSPRDTSYLPERSEFTSCCMSSQNKQRNDGEGTGDDDIAAVSRKLEACTAAITILRTVQKILSSPSHVPCNSSSSSSRQKNCNDLEATRTYVATLHSIIYVGADGFDSSKSLRLARRLVELTNTNMGNNGIRVSSPENAQAYLLLARLLHLNNKTAAQQLLQELENRFESSGLHQHHAEAVALCALSAVSQCTGGEGSIHDTGLKRNNSEIALLQLHRVLASARHRHYPAIESIVCRCASLISTLHS